MAGTCRAREQTADFMATIVADGDPGDENSEGCVARG